MLNSAAITYRRSTFTFMQNLRYTCTVRGVAPTLSCRMLHPRCSNLLLSEGDLHARHRKLISPAFHFLRLKVRVKVCDRVDESR